MPNNYTFSRFIYLDTNILSDLAKTKDKTIWRRLFEFLSTHDLCLGLSSGHLAELSDATRLHDNLAWLLLFMPSAMIKTWNTILDEEVRAHPNQRSDSLLLCPLNQLMLENNGYRKLRGYFRTPELRKARKGQLLYARRQKRVLNKLKPNFPPSKSGKYTWQQADEYADLVVMQDLADTHHDFLASFRDRIAEFHPEVFFSLRLSALVIFYKYYVGRREPGKPSDFGDLFHLTYIPYCKLAVMERDQCEVLNQIKRHGHHDILATTVVRNIDFLQDWKWTGLTPSK